MTPAPLVRIGRRKEVFVLCVDDGAALRALVGIGEVRCAAILRGPWRNEHCDPISDAWIEWSAMPPSASDDSSMRRSLWTSRLRSNPFYIVSSSAATRRQSPIELATSCGDGRRCVCGQIKFVTKTDTDRDREGGRGERQKRNTRKTQRTVKTSPKTLYKPPPRHRDNIGERHAVYCLNTMQPRRHVVGTFILFCEAN